MSSLRFLVLENSRELGEKVNVHLNKLYKNSNEDHIMMQILPTRFSNGEGKVKLLESVREKEVFILADVGNYGMTYNSYGKDQSMGPDEHFQDIIRTISAIRGNAERITIVMPLLYQSRQHRRNGRESLDCALALQELEKMGVKNIVTFDAHDPDVQNAIPLLPFDNFFPTNTILKQFIKENDIDYDKLLVISPDTGAMDRSRYYAGMLGCDLGVFYKRRDYSKIENGKNPVVEHKYLGKEEDDLEYIIVDDMIASGGSVVDILEELKKKKAKSAYVIVTFALFTEGVKIFDDAYKNGILNKVYTTNLSYIPEEYKKREWLEVVDCSKYLADIIDTYHKRQSVSPLLNGKKELYKEIEKTRKERNTEEQITFS